MNDLRLLDNITTALDRIHRQIELSNKITLLHEAHKFGLITTDDYASWLDSAPIINSVRKGEHNV